jgi:hypothetical protein
LDDEQAKGRADMIERKRTAWAIYLLNEECGEHLFHSAHWSYARAREMTFPEWKRDGKQPKIVKIKFEIVQPVKRSKPSLRDMVADAYHKAMGEQA